MSAKGSPTNGTEGDGIDTALLEKRLEGLRDTQESVQGLSLWCQANKRHSQAIVDTWLRILRKSPVEKRLTMFYLANDVVQHAKRKSNVEIVNQWAFAVQKATPHVRSPSSVSNAIARIFKIWEERGIYSKDAIADLLSLLNNVSAKEKTEIKKPETYTANAEKVAAFQPSQLISKFKLAYRLKSHLGTTFRTKSYCQMDMDTLKNSIKDRQHGQDVIQEMGTLVEHLRTSEMKLQTEVEERRKIVETGETAIVFYENVRSESKIVNAAYKNFTNRVMKAYDAVDNKLRSFEEMEKEPSPCPSPPAAAPSPVDDDDVFLDSRNMMSHQGGSNPIEVIKSTSTVDIPTISPSSNSALSHDMNSYMASSPPASTPQPPLQSPIMSNMSMSMPYDPAQSIGGGFDNVDFHQQLPNWSNPGENFAAAMMNFNPNMTAPQPPQNYLSPAMQLQLSMQQQSLQAYGYPGKYNQQDVGSIPLPPVPSNPPLPPPESHSHYPHPPLPPQPHNPPLPDIPVYEPQGNTQMDNNSSYLTDNNPKPIDTVYSQSGNKYHTSENPYQPDNIRDSMNEYIPQSVSSDNIFSQSNMQQMDNPFQPKMQSPPYQPHGSQSDDQRGDYQPSSHQSRLPSQENSSHFDSNRDMPSHSEFDFDYDSDIIDNAHHQQQQQSQNFERPKHPQYTPKNFHPYSPSPRTRRPNSRPPGPRNLQPLLTSPNPNPRFQPRTPNALLRTPGDRFNTPNKIPSLLEGPNSSSGMMNNHQFMSSSQVPGFEGYSSFDEPNANVLGANGSVNEPFSFENFPSQNPFEDNSGPPPMMNMNHNNIRPRGPGRGFRGGFRGNNRGMRAGGPRRGRF